jgi:hypothetical protein
MSNYTKSTNFAAKDALASGNAAKIVKGTEIDTEFNNIATAIATKADSYNPTFTGTVTMPALSVELSDGSSATTQAFGNNTTLVATTAFVQAALGAMYPVGSIYTNAAVSTNPATLLGFGTWVAFGTGRVLVGVDASDTAFDTLGETGGSKDATVVSHTHTATVTDSGHTHGALITPPANIADYSYSQAIMGASGGGGGVSRAYNTTATTGISVSNSTTGSSGANANLQPYVTVYMWRRTA